MTWTQTVSIIAPPRQQIMKVERHGHWENQMQKPEFAGIPGQQKKEQAVADTKAAKSAGSKKAKGGHSFPAKKGPNKKATPKNAAPKHKVAPAKKTSTAQIEYKFASGDMR